MTDHASVPRRQRLQRRLRLRLSPERVDDAAFLDALDERSEILGEVDHAFIRRCLLNGFQLAERIDEIAKHMNGVATYSNNSQYTRTDSPSPAPPTLPASEPRGSGVRSLAGLMGGRSPQEGNET